MAARPQGEGSPRRRHLLGALIALSTILVALPARADDLQEFELAKSRYDAGQYDDAAARFKVMLDPARPACDKGGASGACRISDKDVIERARALYAVSLWALQRKDEADAEIELILRQNPAYTPHPDIPQDVVDRIAVVRARLRPILDKIASDKIEADRLARLREQQRLEDERARLKQLTDLAAIETVVTTNSRAIAMIPFGVGQFQNGEVARGAVFLATEVVVGATSIISAILIDVLEADAREQLQQQSTGDLDQPVDKDALADSIAGTALLNRIAFGVWASVSVIGIIEAQVNFVPERTTTRPRSIPPLPTRPPALQPTVSIQSGGATFGVVGRF
jgi:hypothetical protein